MNARTLLRRRRRHLFIGASLTLALIVGVTSWDFLATPTFGPMILRYTTGHQTINSTTYQTASYGVKSSQVTADTSSSPSAAAVVYSTPPSSVPEPTSLLLMAPALLLLQQRRRSSAR
jgi:hypothetical protein